MQKKQKRLYELWSLGIVVSLLLLVFGFFFASCSKPEKEVESTQPPVISSQPAESKEPSESEEPSESTEPSGTETPVESTAPEIVQPASVVLGETADMGAEYVNQIIFLGDSTTYGLGYYGVVDKGQIWTPSGGTLTLSLWSYTAIAYPDTGEELMLADCVAAKKPAYMVITLGVNGISFMDETSFKTEYTKLVRCVQENSPETKIIINSIYPVAASYAHQSDINNTKIRQANEWLKAVAEETGTRYLDSNSVLLGSDGWLPESLHNGDGMHLNATGFDMIIQNLRTHGYQ
ncbi:MAG: SGNH/GDSL hydrolase family protein [Eubacteriales bacterium]|nr:SGNH/GDSL hydrolase family protein [Eubacteriales bacterium]